VVRAQFGAAPEKLYREKNTHEPSQRVARTIGRGELRCQILLADEYAIEPAVPLFPKARETTSRVINKKLPCYGGFLHQCRRFNTSSWRDAEKPQNLEKKSPRRPD
jgi:hypothetical protein